MERFTGRTFALAKRTAAGFVAGAFFWGFGFHAAQAGNGTAVDLYATQIRASTPAFQLFLSLNDDGSVATEGPAFSVGGIYAADFMGSTLYGTELDNDNLTDYYLVTFVTDGFAAGTGSRVSGSPIGLPAVEGLAVIDDTIYVVSLSFSAHRTTLATVDPSTGTATTIGQPSRNVMLVGLAYDPSAGVLYGVGVPFGAGESNAVNTHNLYRIDPATGAETLVGELGAEIQALTWDDELGLVGAFENLYTIDSSSGAATQLGSMDFTDGRPGTFNGIYALGAMIPDDISTCVCGDPIPDASMTHAVAPSSAALITASDALAVLNASVGLSTCELCACDVNNSGGITATDALTVLGAAVGLPNELTCPSP